MKVEELIDILSKLNKGSRIHFVDQYTGLMVDPDFENIEEIKKKNERYDPPLKKGDYIVEVNEVRE